MSYLVAQRTREIGIRMALGAPRRGVIRLVVGHGMKLALAGVALGLAGALALTRLMSSLLFDMSPTDPLTFAAVSLILAAVSLVATYVPARRASRVDPMLALRHE
jgi:putative ABC transport system permease protein